MQNKSILHNSSYHFVGQKFPQNTYICGSYCRMRLLLSTITFCQNKNRGYYYMGGFYSSAATIMDTTVIATNLPFKVPTINVLPILQQS